MARQKNKRRAESKFEDGYFIPSVPIPNSRKTEDYRWYHSFSAIKTIMANPLESFNTAQFENPVTQYKLFFQNFSVINDPHLIKHCFVDNRQNYKFNAIHQRVLHSKKL